MLKQTPKNFREFFLLEFTKELIRSTNTYREIRIKKEVRKVLRQKQVEQELLQKDLEKRKVLRGVVKEKIKKESERISQLKEDEILPEFKKFYSFAKPVKRQESMKQLPVKISLPPKPGMLKIPEFNLPETFQYLKPTPTKQGIDLGKLAPLIRDFFVWAIECNGPNERIIVIGKWGRKSTNIILNKEEIDDIINKFSRVAKIPVHEGVFKVVFENLIFSAIISEIVGSKFLIRKMMG